MTVGRSSYTILNDGALVIQRIDWGGQSPNAFATLTAWVPSSIMGEHSTITHIEGRCYGQVGTERLPRWIDALPAMTEERSAAVRSWHALNYGRAYEAIEAAVPQAAEPRLRDMGEITIDTPYGLTATTPTL